MNVFELANVESFELTVAAQNREIESVYCADLLSWAMGRAPEGCAWCTVMGNVNAVAVASLADMAVMVLCEGAVLDPDAKAKAEEQGINIVKTALPSFMAGTLIAKKSGVI